MEAAGRARKRRRAGTLVAGVLGAAALLGACGGTGSEPESVETVEQSAVASPTPGIRLVWEPCDLGAACATVEVPLDYGDPSSRMIELGVFRMLATDRERKLGLLFVNPGGPGISAIEMAKRVQDYFPEEITARFDIVGFDPRGVGKSVPIDCGDDFDDVYPTDYTPEEEHERLAIDAEMREFAEACVRMQGDLLPHVTTMNAARDMDRIREAFGVDQISYFGWSYGTLLGAVYADLYPQRVRAMILDGGIDPSRTFEETQMDQARALEDALNAFFARCAADAACELNALGQPAAIYDRLLAGMEQMPLPAYYWGVELVPEDLMSATLSGIREETWGELTQALAQAYGDEDGSMLAEIVYRPFDPHNPSNYRDVNAAYSCNDEPGPQDPALVHRTLDAMRRETPRLGIVSAYWFGMCPFWPAPDEPFDETVTATGAPPIIVMGSRIDPATPYEWSVALAEQLEPATLVTYEGWGHTTAFVGRSACMDDVAVRYLVELLMPAEGAVCG